MTQETQVQNLATLAEYQKSAALFKIIIWLPTRITRERRMGSWEEMKKPRHKSSGKRYTRGWASMYYSSNSSVSITDRSL